MANSKTDSKTAENSNPSNSNMEMPSPDPALKRLERLIGTWDLRGRTLGATADDIIGRATIEWMLDGFFIKQYGEWDILGAQMRTMEIIGYDPATQTYPAVAYSNMNSLALSYQYDIQGDVLTHWTAGARYVGTFSPDGRTLTGGWRPDEGIEAHAGNAYDAVMTRVG